MSRGYGVLGTVYWMEMHFFTMICCKNCIVCLKRSKINEKEARVGPIFLDYYVKFWASDDYAITN